MKTFEQAKDVLDNVQDLHDKAGKLYLKLSRQTKSERMKMLLDHMGQHEEKLKENIAAYERDASPKVLEAWFQYTQEETTAQLVEELEVEDEISVAEVTAISLKIDNYLQSLFEEVSDMSRSREVKEVFQNLSEMEKEEKRYLAKVLNSMMDF